LILRGDFIDEFNIVARILFKEHVVKQANDINPFIARIPWIIQRGPFATAFSSGIGRLSQSGLVERWSKHNLIGKVMHTTQSRFKSMRDLENKLVDESTQEEMLSRLSSTAFKWQGFGRFYSKFMLVPDKSPMLASAQSVPLIVMKLPFLACLVLISFSIVGFLVECVAAKLRSTEINHSSLN
jgi:hypothetical protein